MGMVRRRTRRRTMMVAGGMAYARGRNQGQQDELQSEQAYADEPPPAPAPPPPAPSAGDAAGELERLASLHQSGALTDDEFAAAKQKVLGV
jgi:Short C-terminal domain